jgi:hypothetical protein
MRDIGTIDGDLRLVSGAWRRYIPRKVRRHRDGDLIKPLLPIVERPMLANQKTRGPEAAVRDSVTAAVHPLRSATPVPSTSR